MGMLLPAFRQIPAKQSFRGDRNNFGDRGPRWIDQQRRFAPPGAANDAVEIRGSLGNAEGFFHITQRMRLGRIWQVNGGKRVGILDAFCIRLTTIRLSKRH